MVKHVRGAVVARNETFKKKQKMISMPIKPNRMKAKNYYRMKHLWLNSSLDFDFPPAIDSARFFLVFLMCSQIFLRSASFCLCRGFAHRPEKRNFVSA
jgi:hypothetical protein